MADIWQQFHSLPKVVRDGVSTPQAIAALADLERQYPSADLWTFVMRLVVREFPLEQAIEKLQAESGLSAAQGQAISSRLRQDVFVGIIAEYLGLAKPVPPVPPVVIPPLTPPLTAVKTPTIPKPTVAPPPVPPRMVNVPPAPITNMTPPRMPRVGAPPPVNLPRPVPLAPTMPPVMPAPIPLVPRPPAPHLEPDLYVPPPAPTSHYSNDDADEIARQSQRLKAMTRGGVNQDLDALARSILTQQNMAFSDELLDRRAVAIVKARLKDIRTTADTTAVLQREPKLGGLGLDHEIAEQVAAAAERQTADLKARGMVAPLPPPPTVPPPPAIPKVAQLHPSPMPPMRRDAPLPPTPVLPNVTEAPRPSRPIIRPPDIPRPSSVSPFVVTQPAPTTPSAPVTPPTPVTTMPPVMKTAPLTTPVDQLHTPVMANPTSPVPATPPLTIVQGNRIADRPTVSDIVRPSRVLGPAEEMRSLTLLEFRRLGQGAADTARRLYEKFQHLQRESFTVWVEAVNGWRQSDVYQLYLAMGRESLEQGIPIAQVIADRGRRGEPYLSEHEFTVISDFNRQLQF